MTGCDPRTTRTNLPGVESGASITFVTVTRGLARGHEYAPEFRHLRMSSTQALLRVRQQTSPASQSAVSSSTRAFRLQVLPFVTVYGH
jgi:hypothetical protein